MDIFEKSRLININDKYESIIKALEEAKYLLRIQARHEEAEILNESIAGVTHAMNVFCVEHSLVGVKTSI